MDKVEAWEEHGETALGILKEAVQKRNAQSDYEDLYSEVRVLFFEKLEEFDSDRGDIGPYMQSVLQQQIPQLVRESIYGRSLSESGGRIAEVVNAIRNRLMQKLNREPKLWEIAREWEPEPKHIRMPCGMDALPLGDFCRLDATHKRREFKGRITRLKERRRIINALPTTIRAEAEARSVMLDRIDELGTSKTVSNPERNYRIQEIRQEINQKFEDLTTLQREMFVLDTGYIPVVADVGDSIIDMAGSISRREIAEWLVEERSQEMEQEYGFDYSLLTIYRKKLHNWFEEIYDFFRQDPVLEQAMS